jgi:hypothetical protein
MPDRPAGERADAVGDRIFIEGNSAAALGAVYGGATVCAWYPITPSSSLAEAFSRHCARYRVDPETKENRFAIVQAEDEIASIGMVIGAGWNGARAFTATSGPGISLMQEFSASPISPRFRRSSSTCSAAGPRPACRRARSNPTSRLRLCLARRHQARAAVSGRPARVLRILGAGLRSRRPAADADLRHARSRHRHEPPAVQSRSPGTTRGATTAAR